MIGKKMDVMSEKRLVKVYQVPEWRLWTALCLGSMAVGMISPFFTESFSWEGLVGVVLGCIPALIAIKLLSPALKALVFLRGDDYDHELTIRSEFTGNSEAFARLVELAHAMQEVDDRQNENRKAMKTAASREAREHHRQVDMNLSLEFKELQTRFYALHKALYAKGYNLAKEATFTNYLFPKEDSSENTLACNKA